MTVGASHNTDLPRSSCHTIRTTASNLNYRPGQTVSNLVIVPVGLAGKIGFYNHAGNADVVVDFEGLFMDPSGDDNTTSFAPVAPSRVLDTRDGTSGFQRPVSSNGSSMPS